MADQVVLNHEGRTVSRLRGLDSLRGLAALAVVLFHYTTGYAEHLGFQATHPLFYAIHGHFGVELFFCISGFVILGTIERTANLRRFAIARFARIYPAYLISAVISLATAYLAHFRFLGLNAIAIALNATMLTGLTGTPPIDPSYWTLSYEVLFYLGAAVVWSLLGVRKRLEVPCLVWLACSLVGHLVPWVEEHRRLCVLLNIDYANLFVAGMMLYYVSQGSTSKLTIPTLWAAFVLTLFPPEYNGGHLSQTSYITMIALFWTAIWIVSKSAGKFLNIRPLVFLGEISYSLYLIHQIVGFAFMRSLLRVGLDTNVSILLTISAVVGVAFGLRVLVEKPAERWIKSLDTRHRNRASEALPAAAYRSVGI